MRRRKRSERAGELGGLSAAASALLPPSFAFFPLHALGFLPSFLPSFSLSVAWVEGKGFDGRIRASSTEKRVFSS